MNILRHLRLDRPVTPLCSRKADLTSVNNWGGYCEESEIQQVSINSNQSEQHCVGLDNPNTFAIALEHINSLNQRISELEEMVCSKTNVIETQASEIEKLRAENERLQSLLEEKDAPQDLPKYNFRKLTPQLKRRVSHKLDEVAFPRDIIRRLNAHQIFKVSDLIRCSEADLSQLDGLTADHIDKIKKHLSFMRLQLDTEILYVDGLGDYYLKEMI